MKHFNPKSESVLKGIRVGGWGEGVWEGSELAGLMNLGVETANAKVLLRSSLKLIQFSQFPGMGRLLQLPRSVRSSVRDHS